MINLLRADFPFLINYKKALGVVTTLCSLSFLFVLFTGSVFSQPGQKSSSLGFIVLFMVFSSQVLLRVLIPCFFKGQFSERKWTVFKEIIWVALEIFSGIAFCYLLLLYIWKVPDGDYLRNTIKNTSVLFVAIHFFMVPLSIYIKREMVLQDYLKKAKNLNVFLIKLGFDSTFKSRPEVTVKLKSNDGNGEVKLPIKDVLFLKGAHNYVEVYYLSEQRVKRILLRNTLKSLLKELELFESFILCHRSFIINIRQVVNINGNSRGYKVLLKDYEEFIPVSRQKAHEFEVAIENMGTRY